MACGPVVFMAAGPNERVVRLGDVQLGAEAVVVSSARCGCQTCASAPATMSRCHTSGRPALAC